MGIFDRIKEIFREKDDENPLEITDEKLKDNLEKSVYPETKNFFQRIAEEFGFKGWGRGEEVTREEDNIETQKKFQDFVNQLAIELANWWGMPSAEVKGRIPVVEIVTPTLFEEYAKYGIYASSLKDRPFYDHINNKIIFPENWIKVPSEGLMGWKAILGEEVGHFVEGLAHNRTMQIREFFGTISRLCIAERVQGSFLEEYKKYVFEASRYNEMVKSLTGTEKYMRENINNLSPNWSPEVQENANKNYQKVLDELNHIYQYPAAYLFQKIKAMKPAQRYELLVTSKVTDLINEGISDLQKLSERIKRESPLSPYMYRRYLELSMLSDEEKLRKGYTPEQFAELKRRVDNSFGGLKNSGEFFERHAKEVGFKGYGRQEEIKENEQFKREEEEDSRKVAQNLSEENRKFEEEDKQDIEEVAKKTSEQDEQFEREEAEEMEKEKAEKR